MKSTEVELVRSGAPQLQARFGPAPPIVVVLGSCLGPLVEALEDRRSLAYSELTEHGWISPSVAGHAGELVLGQINSTACAMLSGRIHLYEGYSASEVVRQVRTLRAWGVKLLILTSAAGGIYRGAEEGQLVVVRNHLNFQATNPLIGPACPFFSGERFPDMTVPYNPTMSVVLETAISRVVGQSFKQRPPKGVHASVLGPVYETAAEVSMLHELGADTVSMSLAQEVIAWYAMPDASGSPGLVCAVTMVANAAAGQGAEKLRHADVVRVCEQAGVKLIQALTSAIPHMAERLPN